VATVRAARRTALPASLDAEFRSTLNHDGDPLSFADIVPAPDDSYAQVDDADASGWLGGLLFAALDTRERLVLSLRIGLCGEAQDYATIGRRVGLTRERVRQIAADALAKLRRHPQVQAEQTSRKAA
jgi:DNA-directed RNA polymerase sigma subunit (sigma70/sigma32)